MLFNRLYFVNNFILRGINKNGQQFSVSAIFHLKEKNSKEIFTTVDNAESIKFKNLSQKWWHQNGPYKALHALNELRVPLIVDNIVRSKHLNSFNEYEPLKGIKILDVGCGGGILSEPLARLGATVQGIDTVEDNIFISKQHALKQNSNFYERLSYQHTSLEDFIDVCNEKYDAVILSEVIEHVQNPKLILLCVEKILDKNGVLLITTINKTWISWLIAIIAAEYILNIVPHGLHDWYKFVEPKILETWLKQNGLITYMIHGMLYNPLTNRWYWTYSSCVNYCLIAIKKEIN